MLTDSSLACPSSALSFHLALRIFRKKKQRLVVTFESINRRPWSPVTMKSTRKSNECWTAHVTKPQAKTMFCKLRDKGVKISYNTVFLQSYLQHTKQKGMKNFAMSGKKCRAFISQTAPTKGWWENWMNKYKHDIVLPSGRVLCLRTPFGKNFCESFIDDSLYTVYCQYLP